MRFEGFDATKSLINPAFRERPILVGNPDTPQGLADLHALSARQGKTGAQWLNVASTRIHNAVPASNAAIERLKARKASGSCRRWRKQSPATAQTATQGRFTAM